MTFSQQDHGVKIFAISSSTEDVVEEVCGVFAEGRLEAQQQLEHCQAQSANAPGRNSEWRQIRQTNPSREAFLSTSAPPGDPNSLLRANDAIRQPAVRDGIIVAPRTPPKAVAPVPKAPPVEEQPTMPVVPKTPPKSPPTPPQWSSYRPDPDMPRAWIEPAPLNRYGRWQWHWQNGWCGVQTMITTLPTFTAQSTILLTKKSGPGWKTVGTTLQCDMALSTCDQLCSPARLTVMPTSFRSLQPSPIVHACVSNVQVVFWNCQG